MAAQSTTLYGPIGGCAKHHLVWSNRGLQCPVSMRKRRHTGVGSRHSSEAVLLSSQSLAVSVTEGGRILCAQRRQMGAAFTPPAMQSYVPRVLATCEAHLDRMASQERFNLNEAVRG